MCGIWKRFTAYRKAEIMEHTHRSPRWATRAVLQRSLADSRQLRIPQLRPKPTESVWRII